MKSKMIGNNIKRRRKELNMTQAELAERAQISDVHISHIETAKVAMSLESLLAICKALRTTPNDILLGEYYYPVDENGEMFHESSEELDYDDKVLLQQIARLLKIRHKNKDDFSNLL
ncbi:MAG: helix-turn-helix transcriptional regulator [Butyribacter sp.]|nr:helix-turn-helix transcriptional regulator [bacterium]MDY3854950.1 helix-turn-helix transcriptional regulator [Butyribacter sp.]